MPTKKATTKAARRYYFVDEAGDTVLFGRGKLRVGTQGCSRYFILGYLEVPEPIRLSESLENLRAELLSDPYFKGRPSFDPKRRKTALAFHATDDLPEVRREVFKLLRGLDGLKFFAVVRDKMAIYQEVRKRQQHDPKHRYHPNDLYDSLVRRLFTNNLHKGDEFHIWFAERGKADRTKALETALKAARANFQRKWRISTTAPIHIQCHKASAHSNLQAVDYYLWALQRFYENREESYIEYVWPSCRLVIDIDDRRKANYGEYYTKKKPLNRTALEGRLEQVLGI